jgi:hypothetical protein
VRRIPTSLTVSTCFCAQVNIGFDWSTKLVEGGSFGGVIASSNALVKTEDCSVALGTRSPVEYFARQLVD